MLDFLEKKISAPILTASASASALKGEKIEEQGQRMFPWWRGWCDGGTAGAIVAMVFVAVVVVALAVVALEVAVAMPMVVTKASVTMAMVAEVQVAAEVIVAVGVVIRRRASPSVVGRNSSRPRDLPSPSIDGIYSSDQ